jgi:uncharacterized iron-regulated membrane protein
MRLRVIRAYFVWQHRWVGLCLTGFLIIVGLTGSLLAFNIELERIFAPQLFARPRPGVAPLDLATLAERAQTLVPEARVDAVLMTEDDQASVYFTARPDPATGQPRDLGFTEFFIDPWTGEELGRRVWADLSQGRINLMPFIYELHYALALGEAGQWIFGILALIWTVDCFVGFYLTLPVSLSQFWRRWRSAWLIKRGASAFRLNFDLHRATALWLWPMLFIIAWSAVMMNIRPVYEPVMQALFDYRSIMDPFTPAEHPNNAPRLDWHAALRTGERLMAEQARLHDFTVGKPLTLMYLPDDGAYLYEVRGSRDLFERSPKGGGTAVMFDGNTGAFRDLSQPTGEHTGNTIESWLYALHMARVFGLPYRLFVCLLGLLVPMLSLTGVYIWWKKRLARISRRTRIAPASIS